MTSYWVRPATSRDDRAVRDLARRARRELRLDLRGPSGGLDEDSGELRWVVEAGRGEIVGSCGVRETAAGVWELVTPYLAPVWRGLGLGRLLVEHAIRAAQVGGALEVTARVAPDGLEASRLLRSLGFVEAAAGADDDGTLVLRLGRAV